MRSHLSGQPPTLGQPWFRWSCGLAVALWAVNSSPVTSTEFQHQEALSFDVASVRPSASARRFVAESFPDRLHLRGYTVKRLIELAYGLGPHRLVGGPGWIDSSFFDIVATFKTEAEGRGERVRLMLRTLLADRFELRVSAQRLEQQYYLLTLATPDKKPHTNIRPSRTDCVAYAEQQERDGPPATPPTGPHCGVRFQFGGGLQTMFAGAVTMSGFARLLQGDVGHLVQDGTGLTGRFDMDLKYRRDETLFPFPDGFRERFGSPPDGSPGMFAALEEQLGLALESRRGPVEVLVVEHVEKPTPD